MPIDHAFLRTIDWSRTPVGPIEGWPQSLKSFVDMILGLPTPAIVFWGPEQTQIYNDGYAVIMGPRHPRYYGATYKECWPDTYPLLMPRMREILDEGRYVEVTRAAITVTRHGFPEEAFFTFTFSPLRDDEGKIAGVYQPVIEVTSAVLRERRAGTLHALASRGEVLTVAAAALEANPGDVPFAGVFVREDGEAKARLAHVVGFEADAAGQAPLGAAEATIARVLASNETTTVELEKPVVARPWPEPVRTLVVVPMRRSKDDEPLGVVVFGASPRLHLDRAYREFFEGVAREVGAGLAAERAEQAEREMLEREQTARRSAELVKEANARRLARLFYSTPVGIAVLRGPEHVFEVVNPRYASLLPGRELMNRPIRDALPELDSQGLLAPLDRVYATCEPYVGHSVNVKIDGVGDERFFDFVYQPMPGDDGLTDSIIVVIFEVTDLSRARRDAEAANRAKDEFFAILGHELRNPLAPIVTALQLMRRRDEQAFRKERATIERQVRHIGRLVDDLLDVSRITRGKVALARTPVEISDVVERAVEMASPLLEERRHHLVVDVPKRGLVVDGDPTRLAQVVSNLLANAAKYTEPGGRVRVEAELRADLAADVATDVVILRVVDTGIGIAKEMLARVFEPFAQEGQDLDRARGGLGLGLTIVRSLVELHGGSVTASSAGRGQGSAFAITLPLATETAPEAPPSEAYVLPATSAAALRVLVVDDNEDAAEMLAEGLELLGYETRVAYDGPEALDAACDFAPDVAILDIGLPVMDGYELARRLRLDPALSALRLFALTGYGQESDRRRASEAGFHAHLVKPIDLDVLARLLESQRSEIPRASGG